MHVGEVETEAEQAGSASYASIFRYVLESASKCSNR